MKDKESNDKSGMAYHIIRASWRLMSLLPMGVLHFFSDLIYFPLYYVARYRRKVAHRNLVNAFPEKTEKEIARIEKKFYSSFCDYVMETVKLMGMSREKIKRHLRFEGTEEVARMAETEGRSCVVYMSHTFNWEFVTSLPLHFENTRIQFGQIYHPLVNKNMDRLFLEMRNQYGAESISMTQTLRRILQLGREKTPFVIGFIADQVPHWEAIDYWMDFFHQETPVFTGTEKIARRTGSAVFYMSVRKEKRGHYIATFHKMSDNASQTAENELTKKYYQMLEADIAAHPELWLWTHKRWKRTKAKYQEWDEKRRKRLREKENATSKPI